jgi:hypothetical protein
MVSILVVDKTGKVSELSIKTYDETTLFKKAGFKVNTDFKLQHTFNALTVPCTVSVYGKTTGKSNVINKYDFPPPIDNVIFYGNCLLVARAESTNELCELTVVEWDLIYSTLFGGFEDINESSSEVSEESVDEALLTKDGYLKDDFIVDDSEVESLETADNMSDISIDKKIPVKKIPVKKIPVKKIPVKKIPVKKIPVKELVEKKVTEKKIAKKNCKKVEQQLSVDDTYLGCACELEADEYFK